MGPTRCRCGCPKITPTASGRGQRRSVISQVSQTIDAFCCGEETTPKAAPAQQARQVDGTAAAPFTEPDATPEFALESSRSSAIQSQPAANGTFLRSEFLPRFAFAVGVAVTTSSFDIVPFVVFGGNGDGSFFNASRDVETRPNNGRPEGMWAALSPVGVMSSPQAVWMRLSDIQNFFTISLAGMGTTVTRQSRNTVRVEISGSGGLSFVETDRDEEMRFIVFELVDIDPTVFPKFNFEGSELYFAVMERDGQPGTADVEIGWGNADLELGSEPSNGLRILESLVVKMLLNIGREFGQICEEVLNVRTVEGDCNNLRIPDQGVAGSALRRLGGPDPAYPGGNRNIPAGPLAVNVRNVSNGLFAMSKPLLSKASSRYVEVTCRSWSQDPRAAASGVARDLCLPMDAILRAGALSPQFRPSNRQLCKNYRGSLYWL